MKIKKIIYMYLFSISLNLLGSEIVDSIEDKDLKEAIEASLNDYNAKVVNEQNLEYKNLEKKNQLETVKNTVSEKALVIFTSFNEQIKKANNAYDHDQYDAINKKIKSIMNIIPHEVLELEKINELRSFTNRWATIQREGSRIIDPLDNKNTTELQINIYKEALKVVNKYIEENDLNEDQIINEQKNQIMEEMEEEENELALIYEKIKRELDYDRDRKENENALRQIKEFEEHEKERKIKKLLNDPHLIAIQKIRETMYEKVSNYFNKENFETALKEAKEKKDETSIEDIQENIEDIMKFCPHEIFNAEMAKKFPQIKIAWESTQRQHHLESKIHNPTEQNQEDLETWQKNSRDLEEYIKNYEKFNFKLLKFLKPKKNIIIGAGIGLFTSLGTFKIKDNLFRKKSTEKKIPLLQKAFILSGFTILGGIGGKYFYQMKTIFNKN